MRYAVIMAGGGGTRLWPTARQDNPKQLQRLIFKRPLIAETVQRLARVFSMRHILIVTAERYGQPIRDALPGFPPENVITEPVGKNTAAAIALAAFQIVREDHDAVFAVFPADHVVLQPDALYAAVEYASDLALRHRVVDIGVPPSHPETGYGYIELGEQIDSRNGLTARRVRRFIEKPSRARAEEYLRAGNYIWNSGMFVWRASEFLDALKQHLPDTYGRLKEATEGEDGDQLRQAYVEIENISVDYAIMEKVSDVVAVPIDFGWRDIGDWSALYDMMEHDQQGNAITGKHVTLDTENCFLFSPHKLVATVGLRDLIVVETDDVLLVMPRERSQEVKQILEKLKDAGYQEYL